MIEQVCGLVFLHTGSLPNVLLLRRDWSASPSSSISSLKPLGLSEMGYWWGKDVLASAFPQHFSLEVARDVS